MSAGSSPVSPGPALSFCCPSCAAELSVPTTMAGVSGPCPSCAETITAPQPQVESASETPIEFDCGGCGRGLSVPPSMRDVEGPCPSCGTQTGVNVLPPKPVSPVSKTKANKQTLVPTRSANLESLSRPKSDLPTMSPQSGSNAKPERSFNEALARAPESLTPELMEDLGAGPKGGAFRDLDSYREETGSPPVRRRQHRKRVVDSKIHGGESEDAEYERAEKIPSRRRRKKRSGKGRKLILAGFVVLGIIALLAIAVGIGFRGSMGAVLEKPVENAPGELSLLDAARKEKDLEDDQKAEVSRRAAATILRAFQDEGWETVPDLPVEAERLDFPKPVIEAPALILVETRKDQEGVFRTLHRARVENQEIFIPAFLNGITYQVEWPVVFQQLGGWIDEFVNGQLHATALNVRISKLVDRSTKQTLRVAVSPPYDGTGEPKFVAELDARSDEARTLEIAWSDSPHYAGMAAFRREGETAVYLLSLGNR